MLRLDQIFTRRARRGQLRPDPTLSLGTVEIDPQMRALIEAARRAEEAARGASEVVPRRDRREPRRRRRRPTCRGARHFTVQVATPDARLVDTALASVRGAPGRARRQRSAASRSAALRCCG